jgi:hypothetical protein
VHGKTKTGVQAQLTPRRGARRRKAGGCLSLMDFFIALKHGLCTMTSTCLERRSDAISAASKIFHPATNIR